MEVNSESASHKGGSVCSRPSRLVNLHLHDTDLAQQKICSQEEASNQIAVSPAPMQSNTDTNTLAISIAADYTAATLDATMANLPVHLQKSSGTTLSAAVSEAKTTESISEIAQTAAQAIAAIRSATDPDDIATQITALKDFATKIRRESSIPEVTELSNTIEKFVSIAEKSTGIKAKKDNNTTIKVSCTSSPKPLTPKANRAATKVVKSSAKMVANKNGKIVLGHSAKVLAAKPTKKITPVTKKSPSKSPISAPKAHRNCSVTDNKLDNDATLRRTLRSISSVEDEVKPLKKRGRAAKVIVALGCAAACIAAIIYFVGSNIPDISVRVAALQSGVNASYPSYVPSGFSLTNIGSDDGKMALVFSNALGQSFLLIEEKSSWDSTALQRNYVETAWGQDYSTTHEQGITIYMHGSNAAWVNGGVLYKITADEDVLTKKQLRNIVTSM